jgi:hypothetical protein
LEIKAVLTRMQRACLHHHHRKHSFRYYNEAIELAGGVGSADILDLERISEHACNTDDGQRGDPDFGAPCELPKEVAFVHPGNVLSGAGEDAQQEDGAPAFNEGNAAKVADMQSIDELLSVLGIRNSVPAPSNDDESPYNHGDENQEPIAGPKERSCLPSQHSIENQIAVEGQPGLLYLPVLSISLIIHEWLLSHLERNWGEKPK